MANQDAAFGFRPVRHLSGGEIRTNEYKIAANYGTSIFMGSPVLAVTAGGIEVADDSSGTNPVSYGRFDTVAHTDDNKVVYLEAVIHKSYLAGVLTFARSGSGTATVGVKVHAIPHKGRSETRTA